MSLNKNIYLGSKVLLKDRYTIKSVQEESGLTISYLAYDSVRKENVVIKELFPRLMVERAYFGEKKVELLQLSDEALFLQMKEHIILDAKKMIKLFPLEGVANVLTYFEENQTVYVVFEYVEGNHLSDYFQRDKEGKFELNSILNFFEPMILSLDKIHKEKFFHGKIRPNQMIVTPKNGLKLIGFCEPCVDIVYPPYLEGDDVTRDTSYSAVEQFMEDGVQGSYTDVYGLCATIYHSITGRKPSQFFERIGTKDLLKSPYDLKIDITMKQSEALMKGLAPLTFERYATISELVEAIYEGADSEEFRDNVKPLVLYNKPFAFIKKVKIKRRIITAATIIGIIFVCVFGKFVYTQAGQFQIRHFYKSFHKKSLYEKCETLKWLSEEKRDRYTNNYNGKEETEDGYDFEIVYYDLVGNRFIDRDEFLRKKSYYKYLEISYRPNNEVLVVYYSNQDNEQYYINLNNYGSPYNVTHSVEQDGKIVTNEFLEVAPD